MPFPTLDNLRDLIASGRGNTIPLYVEMPSDLLSPVSVYLKLAHETSHSFLFESVEGGSRIGRYSFIGADPTEIMSFTEEDGDPLRALEAKLASVRFVPVDGLPSFTGMRCSGW